MIREIRAGGTGVVYVSHRLDEIHELSDRVSVLRDGCHVGTVETASVTRAGLIRLITGSNAEHQPGSAVEATGGAASVVLSVTDLSSGLLKSVSFAMKAGEVVGFAGLAGSGRERLAYALTGAAPAQVTSIKVGATRWCGALAARNLARAGMVLCPGSRQRGAAVAEFTVTENVTLPVLRRYGRRGHLRRRHEKVTAERWIGQLRLSPPDPGRRYRLLSGGNQQKVLIARALNQSPVVIVLDEPTAGVDIGAREAIYQLVRAEAVRGVAFVVVSSDLEDLVALADRVFILRKGSVHRSIEGRAITKDDLLHLVMGEPDHEEASDDR